MKECEPDLQGGAGLRDGLRREHSEDTPKLTRFTLLFTLTRNNAICA